MWEFKIKEKNIYIPTFTSLDDFYRQQEQVLKAEIAYLRRNGGKRIKIFDGKLVEGSQNKYTYSFESDSELNLPDNTQISVWFVASNDSIPAAIIDCEDFTVIISTTKNLGETVPICEFSAESWRLLSYLIDRLTTLREKESVIVKELVCDGRKKSTSEVEYQKDRILPVK